MEVEALEVVLVLIELPCSENFEAFPMLLGKRSAKIFNLVLHVLHLCEPLQYSGNLFALDQLFSPLILLEVFFHDRWQWLLLGDHSLDQVEFLDAEAHQDGKVSEAVVVVERLLVQVEIEDRLLKVLLYGVDKPHEFLQLVFHGLMLQS